MKYWFSQFIHYLLYTIGLCAAAAAGVGVIAGFVWLCILGMETLGPFITFAIVIGAFILIAAIVMATIEWANSRPRN